MTKDEFMIGDRWFHIHFGQHITQEFVDWWIEFYDKPELYATSEDNLHEYYTRCGFAWHGWKASKDHLSSS